MKRTAEVQPSSDERLAFTRDGLVLLPRAVPAAVNAAIKDHVLSELGRLKIWSNGKPISKSLRALPPFQQVTKVSSSIKYPELAARLGSPRVLAALNVLANGAPLSTRDAQLLVSLPLQGDSTMHGLSWHVDISQPDTKQLPGIQAFLLVDDVDVHGGATMAVGGSHALDHAALKRVRAILKGDGDLEKELAREGLSIREMAGRAGDVYLMDMRTLHSPSINSTKRIRLMATARYFTTT